jgi:hypothetical protein
VILWAVIQRIKTMTIRPLGLEMKLFALTVLLWTESYDTMGWDPLKSIKDSYIFINWQKSWYLLGNQVVHARYNYNGDRGNIQKEYHGQSILFCSVVKRSRHVRTSMKYLTVHKPVGRKGCVYNRSKLNGIGQSENRELAITSLLHCSLMHIQDSYDLNSWISHLYKPFKLQNIIRMCWFIGPE